MNLLNNILIYLIPFKLKIRDEYYIIKGETAWMVESASMCWQAKNGETSILHLQLLVTDS